MSTAEQQTFPGQAFPAPLGVVATLRRDGSPHLVPVWFRRDGAVITIWTTEQRLRVPNLIRDPRAAFSVQTFEAPCPAVVMRGTAAVATADDSATMEEIRAITRRYVPAEGAERYIVGRPHLRTIVSIVPDHIVSWSAGG